MGRIQNYNVRHVITTNEEYDRCLRLFERYYSDMISITSSDDKFLFIQERIKWEGFEVFLLSLLIGVAINVGFTIDNLYNPRVLEWFVPVLNGFNPR